MSTRVSPIRLVGRDDEQKMLRELVARVAAGQGGVAWLEGEPGIGKSALIEAVLADAARAGCEVYRGAASELVSPVPLHPVVDALRVGPGAVDAVRAPLAALLRGEGVAELVTPRDVVAVLAEQVLVLVDRLCAAAPVVIVLDDLHWADDASLAVWSRLSAATAQLPLLAVAACRPVPRRQRMQALRQELVERGARLVQLDTLPQPQVTEMVADLVGAPPDDRLDVTLRQAGGNPLYVRELVDALVLESRIRVDAGVAELVRTGGLPTSLPTAIGRRLGFLSEQARSVLRFAALFGPAFTVTDLVVITGHAATELVAVVDEAVTTGVLAESGDELVFRHGLIREALYEGMPASVRAALHRQAAQALARVGAPAVRVAEHLLAVPGTADAWVVGWILEAASALTHRAPQVAAVLLRRGREGLPESDPRREHLDADLATALFLLGDNEQIEQVARPALTKTRDDAIAGRIAWTLGYGLMRMARLEQATEVVEQALTRQGLPPLWRARLHAMQAMSLAAAGAYLDRAQAAAAQAEAEGLRAGDPLAVGYALHIRAMLTSENQFDEAASLDLMDKALVVLGDRPDAVDLRLLVLGNRCVRLDNMGRPAEADQAIARALVLAEQAGPPPRLGGLRAQAASHNFYRGRWDEALAELQAADGLPLAVNLRPLLRGVRALIALHRDDRATAERQLHGVEDLSLSDGEVREHAGLLLGAWALAAEREGQLDVALSRLLATFGPAATWQSPQLRSDVWLVDVVRLALATGERSIATDATQASIALARRQPWSSMIASAQLCQGLLDADPAKVLDAADGIHRVGYPLPQARALEDAAELFAEGGDQRAAGAAYRQAIALYTDLDAAWDIIRADARLRRYGIRRGRSGPRRRPTTGWESLTPTETKIARLVADGQSNPDIAAALFLSRRTVEAHVSHILAKLNVHSRIDIAREAMRR
ncbi:helix-turn-helix transcriptional regulator [Micromonospora fulviviridis]|uniref:AAA family ATPase n=1 Tax=Micromonospora fulviviridis TaxID=47860 RepID=A0ABV2VMR8_9ACTN